MTPLTRDQLKNEIDASRPVIARLGWYPKGGHFVVITGYDQNQEGAAVAVNDPWPSTGQIVVDYDAFVGNGITKRQYTNTSPAHLWTHSLTMRRSEDVLFLFNSSGGMANNIADIKAEASSLLDHLAGEFQDYRVAVGDYRDYPDGIHGGSADWILKVRSGFTSDLAVAKDAIDGIATEPAAAGTDSADAVYSAAYAAVLGTEFGSWRDDSIPRHVIILGGAPGHYPAEPWEGGLSQSEVISQAIANEVQIHTLLAARAVNDYDPRAVTDFTDLSAGTGGDFLEIGEPSQTVELIERLIDENAADPSAPTGTVADLTPTFFFPPLGASMANAPKKTYLELSLRNQAGQYPVVRLVTLPLGAEHWTPPAPLAKGDYRWRLGSLSDPGPLLAPDGTSLGRVDGGMLFESNYRNFQRTDVTPGTPERITPNAEFRAEARRVTYQWERAPNASSYAVKILKGGKPWRSARVRPPKDHPETSVLRLTLTDHHIGTSYSWTVHGLNLDHPVPD